ncbi:MAG TPA: ROK family protein [Bauldia sp.]|nr:ROK family protein [Bauldia sp.]
MASSGRQGPERRQAVGQYAGTGDLLGLIMSGKGTSRSALVEASGLSRATVSQRLGYLFAAGLVTESDETMPSGGRPARGLRLNTGYGVVVAADIGERKVRVGITDMTPAILAERLADFDLRQGPAKTLAFIAEQADALLRELKRQRSSILAIGVSRPAPVAFPAGKGVGPPIMPGWDGFALCGWLTARLGVPAVADNDVNLLALNEHRTRWRDAGDFFYVKAGTGIGSGIFAGGAVYRGASGAAGDIGHIQLGVEDGPLCRCGKLGCVEARAAGWAIARDLRVQGINAVDASDVVALAAQNRPEAIKLLRQSGRVIGEVISDVVSILNPSVIVVGGTLSRTRDHLLSGIRELVYQRCLPLATRELEVALAHVDPRNGLLGAAQLAIDTRLSPTHVDQMVARRLGRRVGGRTAAARSA